MSTSKYVRTSSPNGISSPAIRRAAQFSAASCADRNRRRGSARPLSGSAASSRADWAASPDASGLGSASTRRASSGSPYQESTNPSASWPNRNPSFRYSVTTSSSIRAPWIAVVRRRHPAGSSGGSSQMPARS
ncbi:hypothetical protein ACFQY7_13045 [Actinomadura luteofluorescens]|uniref:hypothetical protein n=1 Tax=Actinomadura luteofluorescens TaxID=46163 RepID=UPI00363EF5A6